MKNIIESIEVFKKNLLEEITCIALMGDKHSKSTMLIRRYKNNTVSIYSLEDNDGMIFESVELFIKKCQEGKAEINIIGTATLNANIEFMLVTDGWDYMENNGTITKL